MATTVGMKAARIAVILDARTGPSCSGVTMFRNPVSPAAIIEALSRPATFRLLICLLNRLAKMLWLAAFLR